MPELRDVYWLAGLLEGEGTFALRKMVTKRNGHVYTYYRPRICVAMTDKDIIERAASILGVACSPGGHCKSGKPMWFTGCQGSRAAGWMMTLYSLLGTRRQTKIRESLAHFRKEN